MEQTQKDHADSYDRVKDFNTDHATELAVIPEYAAEQLKFDTARAKINDLGEVQAQDISSLEEQADAAKLKMAKTVVKFGKKGKVKATQLGMVTLADELNHSISYIYRPDKQLAIDRARAMRHAMNNNLASLTNLSAGDIALIDADIAAYDEAQAQPISARQHKKGHGTDLMPEEFVKADAAIDNMYDLIYAEYIDTNPGLVNEFRLAMQIINTGVHHTGIKVVVTAPNPPDDPAGVPLKGVKVKILDYEPVKESVTNINGEAVIERFKHGTYDIELTKAGYQTKVVRFTVKRGQHIDIPVTMVLV